MIDILGIDDEEIWRSNLKLAWIISIFECIHYKTRIPQKLRCQTERLFCEPLEDNILQPLDTFSATLSRCRNYEGLEQAFKIFETECYFPCLNEREIEAWIILHSVRKHQNNHELLDSINHYWALLRETTYLNEVDSSIRNMIISFAYRNGDDSCLSSEALLKLYRHLFSQYSTQLKIFKQEHLLPTIRDTWIADFIETPSQEPSAL